MARWLSVLTSLVAAIAGAAWMLHAQERGGAPLTPRIDVPSADLLVHPAGANWPSYNGDYTGQRYSSLSEIDTRNVRDLRVQWVFHSSNSEALEAQESR